MNKLQWKFNQNTNLFIHENASENIACEMAAILSRGGIKHPPKDVHNAHYNLILRYDMSV